MGAATPQTGLPRIRTGSRPFHTHTYDEHVVACKLMHWLVEQMAERAERCRIAVWSAWPGG